MNYIHWARLFYPGWNLSPLHLQLCSWLPCKLSCGSHGCYPVILALLAPPQSGLYKQGNSQISEKNPRTNLDHFKTQNFLSPICALMLNISNLSLLKTGSQRNVDFMQNLRHGRKKVCWSVQKYIYMFLSQNSHWNMWKFP